MRYRATILSLCLLTFSLYADDRPVGDQFAIAIERSDLDKVKALVAAGNSPDTPIEYGEHKIPPLMKAAWEGEAEIVEALLAAGAKVNAKATDTDETALMSAVTKGDPATIGMLLKAGADVNPINKFGFNVFTSAVAAGNEDVAAILLDSGAKIDAGAHGLTPLQFAASAGNINMIRFLVKHGADVNHGAKTGDQTALLSAIYGAHPEVVQVLISLGAKVNTKTKDGDTPLKAAMKGDQDDIVKILKDAGAKQ